MHQEKRLPKNGKEGAIYGAIICTLSVLFIGSINIILAAGEFNRDVAMDMLIMLPIIWVIVMIIEPVAIGRFAEFSGKIYYTNRRFCCSNYVPYTVHSIRYVIYNDSNWGYHRKWFYN